MGSDRESHHSSLCTGAKSHSLREESIGLVLGCLFTVTIFVPSSSEVSSEPSDSDASSSKLRDPATLRSQGFKRLKPTDPTASKLDVSINSCLRLVSNPTVVCGIL